MPTLRVTVDWLDGVYHGEEWPPSPLRLYQAMIAGYAVHRRGDPAFEAAMRHLERLDPPTIHAPEAERRAPVTSAVPNNDGDLVLKLLAKGDRMRARQDEQRMKSMRTRRPRSFDGVVTYQWEADAETERHLGALKEIAGSVSAVGHGTDSAVARLELADRPARPPGVAYTPSPTGRRRPNVPYSGAFDALEERYRQFRDRIGPDGVDGAPEPAHRRSGYASERDLPPIRCEAFRLMDMDDGPLSFEGTRAMAVAAMARHAIGRAAERAGLAEGTISELMGHGGERRIRVHPAPNVGHEHADGRIRRVMMTAPEAVGEDDWRSVMNRLAGAALVPEGRGEPVGTLAPIAGDDRILAGYCGEARAWTTATPVVLWGRDHRRGRPRPERSVRRLLRRAGIPEAMLESAIMEPAGRLSGSDMPSRYDRPRHLEGYPCRHMSIRWRRPVTGPVLLGAGIGYGLGLFLPARIEDRARPRGGWRTRGDS